MKRSLSRLRILLFLLFLVPFDQILAQDEAAPKEEMHEKQTTRKLKTLLYHLENAYVDSVDTPELTETAIKAMLKELDPHTKYIPPERVKQMREPLEGNFEGIGIRFNILNDTILVVRPIQGGPSAKLGIRAGDKIVKIDGEKVAGIGISNSGVKKRLKGEKGTTVEVAIYRQGEPELIHYEIVRDKIPINSVQASYMAKEKIGYIKVKRFSGRTMKEFKTDLKKLKKKGMESLVLDLQGNPGGYLRTGLNMADQFLKKDRLLVYTEGRAFPRSEKRATKEGLFQEGKLVVMIDESSASASEIVAGAVQDWDRGVIIGRRSFGKGFVERPITLPDSSVVRLTISRYHTPSGRCIQKPYEKGNMEAYAKEKYRRLKTGELFHKDSIDLPDSLKYKTRIKKRTVYGGGGIIPDVFVPLDTTGNSDYLEDLRRKRVISDLALTYADEHRKELKERYEDPSDFAKNYKVPGGLKKRIKEKGKKNGVPFDQEGYERSKKFILGQMKGLLAQNLWGAEAYYWVHNPLRPTYRRALEILQDGTFKKIDLAESR
ncbi:MAG: S41 family peptidase [Flavobacteriales bacterium]